MSAGETLWTLFRYHNADGTAKDWAYRHLPDGGIAICWGRRGSVSQSHSYGAAEARAILRRAQEKQRKGYVPLGNAVLRDGALEPLPAPAPSAPSRPKPSAPAVDLSQIAIGQDDFWF
jgi:predicted DNA-binding WGR domain protein